MNIIAKLIYGVPLGTRAALLVWSLAGNILLFSLLALSIIKYPNDGADVPAKAHQLEQFDGVAIGAGGGGHD